MRAMPPLNRLSRPRPYICRQCIQHQRLPRSGLRTKATWAAQDPDPNARAAQWEEQAARIRSGAQRSMLEVLEERGFVKDIAGWVKWSTYEEEAHDTQASRVARLAHDAQTNWRIRRRGPHRALTTCGTSPPADGAVLDVPPRLSRDHAGESPEPKPTGMTLT